MRSPAPAPPIAASLILPAIYLRSNYVPMRPYALICSVFSVLSIFFGSFLFVNFFFFFSPFQFLLILLFLSFSSYLFLFFSQVLFFVFLFFLFWIHLGSKFMYIPVRPDVLTFFAFFFCINIMSPAPPNRSCADPYGVINNIRRENPAKCPSLAKNPPK